MKRPHCSPIYLGLGLTLGFALSACSKSTSSSTVTPDPTGQTTGPTTPEEAAPGVAISSVEMLGDCPASSPAAPAQGATRDGKRVFASPRCFDATLALKIVGDPSKDQTLTLKGIRLKHASKEEALADLRSKDPQFWTDGTGYAPWSGQVSAGSAQLVSYSLSAPDWSAIEKALGVESSMSQTFVLEIDVEIDGEVQTLTSPQFTRSRNDMVVT